MIEVTYTPEIHKFKVKSHFSEWVRLTFSVVDLNTNLGVTGWWMHIYPQEELEYQLSSYDVSPDYFKADYFSGFKLKAFRDDELIFNQVYQYKKEDKKFQFFSNEKEISFGSWEQLVHKDDFKTKYYPEDIVYDLGANVGVYSMWALYNGVKQVYAFEPTPFNVDCLQKTFAWDSNIAIFPKAISNNNEIKTFYLQPHSVCNSLYNTNGIPIEVECINLEDFVKENNLLLPTIVKCDIEGSEYDFIESVSDDFLRNIRVFIIEYHLNEEGKKIWNVIKRFLNLGYKIELGGNTENPMGTLIMEKEPLYV